MFIVAILSVRQPVVWKNDRQDSCNQHLNLLIPVALNMKYYLLYIKINYVRVGVLLETHLHTVVYGELGNKLYKLC